VANFLCVDDKEHHQYPPREVVQDLLALAEWPGIPALDGIVESPVVRPDGTILDQPGSDPATRLLYAPPPAFLLPPLPSTPTPAEVQRAAAWLSMELFSDFPFALDAPRLPDVSASQANAFALLLTPLLRPAIAGPVPLALFHSPKGGNGKTLLARLLTLAAMGREAPIMPVPRDAEEWCKGITAILRQGAPATIVDNIHELGAPALAAVLTVRMWTDRLLGANEMLTLPHHTLWIATGNNVQIDSDLLRRCYSIRLDAEIPHPWERNPADFRHPKILPWVQEHRGDVLAALLTVLRGWYVAGQPAPTVAPPVLGSFEG
jgi:hypothetical protein